jgi:hypothetical protein
MPGQPRRETLDLPSVSASHAGRSTPSPRSSTRPRPASAAERPSTYGAFALYTEKNQATGFVAARKASGRLPLRAYPTLGEHMRGIVAGRCPDRILAAAQAECRFPLVWRLRGTAFLAGGTVVEDWQAFDLGAGRPIGGAGLRYVLNREERLYVRFDIGVTGSGAEMCIQFGEAF